MSYPCDQFDIDSMVFLSFLISLHQEFGVDVPESDAPRLGSIDACIDYLAQALRQGGSGLKRERHPAGARPSLRMQLRRVTSF